MLAIVLLQTCFTELKKFPVFLVCWDFLLWMWVKILWNAFLYLLVWSYGNFFFCLLMWWATWSDYQMLNQDCIPGINPTRSWCENIYFWIQIANDLLRISASMLQDTEFYLQFPFLVMSASFCYYSNPGLTEWVKKYFCFYFLEEIVEKWYHFFLKCLVEFTNEHNLGLTLSDLEDQVLTQFL